MNMIARNIALLNEDMRCETFTTTCTYVVYNSFKHFYEHFTSPVNLGAILAKLYTNLRLTKALLFSVS